MTTFYTDGIGIEHPWGEPYVIGAGDLHDYQTAARDIIERMLVDG